MALPSALLLYACLALLHLTRGTLTQGSSPSCLEPGKAGLVVMTMEL